MSEDATHDAHAKVWDLVTQFRAAMLVTKSQTGTMSARPMSQIARAEEGLVYILTEKATDAALDIERERAALLSFSDGKSYLSLSVQAEVSSNRVLIEDLWNPCAQAFWPNGPTDPKVCAIILRPVAGEYCDGDNTLSAGIKMIIANVTGRPPDLGDHGQVKM